MKLRPRLWSSFLLVSTILVAFGLPALPPVWQKSAAGMAYTVIYITSVLSLKGRTKLFTAMMITAILIHWIATVFDFEILNQVGKAINMLCFTFIVGLMIRQIARADKVDVDVILESIIGYLLLGIVYSIVISAIARMDPGAYNFVGETDFADISAPIYFGFITLTTVGYGDLLPLKPYTRALSSLIAVSGQFYMAIIVALLVGKFAATQGKPVHPPDR